MTRAAPPLIFPRRHERSTVHSDVIMSLASSDRAGSCGKTTGFSRILHSSCQSVIFTRKGEVGCVYSLLVNFNRILVPEWGIARQKLVEKDTQCPPVDCACVSLVLDDLGCEILGGAAKGVGLDGLIVAIS